ncbi:hypothetical protein [Streptomyces sp. NBC_01294]|uniref:hypothetical protein n=1 Tax=Streptomyces sp. NBC_01294 TaxID=2903815 RepID=UPI002DD7EEAE|nr:hypothetical protein [Streptomyces sp. NBC_01294]WRZ57381.1 hypothetical protein OG534_13330 [Streptomyces sp. NBC_01294]
MSIRHTVRVRGGAAAAVAVVLALALAGCGGGNEKPKESPDSSASQPPSGSSPSVAAGTQSAAPPQVLATVNGESGVVLTINSVTREAGGFVTINGQIKNTSTQQFVKTSAWRGNERDLSGSGESVAGATLVDKAGKKRYYVLRDTDGRCLCTTGVAAIDAGATVPFFAQFPAPPTSTTEVEFSLPTFASAAVKITG